MNRVEDVGHGALKSGKSDLRHAACPARPIPRVALLIESSRAYGRGVLRRDSGVRMADLIDGTSSTLLLGEIANPGGDGVNWVRGMGTSLPTPDGMSACKNVVSGINLPDPTGFNNQTFKSLHPGGAQFALADASIRFLSDAMDFQLYRSLASRNGGEPVTAP